MACAPANRARMRARKFVATHPTRGPVSEVLHRWASHRYFCAPHDGGKGCWLPGLVFGSDGTRWNGRSLDCRACNSARRLAYYYAAKAKKRASVVAPVDLAAECRADFAEIARMRAEAVATLQAIDAARAEGKAA